MKDLYLDCLLQMVETGRDLEVLRRVGLEYFQIVELLANAFSAGLLLEQGGGKLALTESGRSRLAAAKQNGIQGWAPRHISPKSDAQIEMRSVNDVYLPDKRWRRT